jgi:ABC-type dipeptide/oligopeptide/nickel transport system permease subunit
VLGGGLLLPFLVALLALAYAGTGRLLAEHTVFTLHCASFAALLAVGVLLPIELLLGSPAGAGAGAGADIMMRHIDGSASVPTAPLPPSRAP